MMSSRKLLSLALLAAGWAFVQPSSAEEGKRGAKELHALATRASRLHARQVTESPNLGFGSIPLPLPTALVREFDRNFERQGLTPPPIPLFLEQNPLPANLAGVVGYRQAFALELARERALLNGSDTYGGIYFQPPLGTPYSPVNNLNLFTYLPVFRILGGS